MNQSVESEAVLYTYSDGYRQNGIIIKYMIDGLRYDRQNKDVFEETTSMGINCNLVVTSC